MRSAPRRTEEATRPPCFAETQRHRPGYSMNCKTPVASEEGLLRASELLCLRTLAAQRGAQQDPHARAAANAAAASIPPPARQPRWGAGRKTSETRLATAKNARAAHPRRLHRCQRLQQQQRRREKQSAARAWTASPGHSGARRAPAQWRCLRRPQRRRTQARLLAAAKGRPRLRFRLRRRATPAGGARRGTRRGKTFRPKGTAARSPSSPSPPRLRHSHRSMGAEIRHRECCPPSPPKASLRRVVVAEVRALESPP